MVSFRIFPLLKNSLFNRVRILGVGLLLVLFLAGCAVPEPPDANEALREALPETTEVRERFAEDPGPDVGALPDNWVESFEDPELEELVEEALQNNLNLQAAGFQVEAAAASVTRSGAGLKPVVSAAAEGSQQNFEGGITQESSRYGLNVSWELDLWGKLRAQEAASVAEYEATLADYEFARLSLKGQVAKAWFMAVEASQQLEYAKEVVELFRNTLEIVKTKEEFGEVGMGDVHLAQADLAGAQERLRQVEGSFRSAQRGLEILLGRYPSAELEVRNGFTTVPPPVPPGLPSELLERRPDLISAQQRVAAAFNLTSTAKAARLPTVGLTAGVGGTDGGLNEILGLGNSFWNVGANFLGPIYRGGQLQAEVDIATAEQEAALRSYGQEALVAFGEVESALNNEILLEQREELLEAIVRENRSAVELAEVQYDAGAIDLLSVLQLRGRLIDSEIALIHIRNLRLAERVNLHLALGGDFEETNS